MSILNALIVPLPTDMSVWEAWIEGGAYLHSCIIREQDGACQFGKRGLRDSKACARFAFGVVQADTVARANWVTEPTLKIWPGLFAKSRCALSLVCWN